MERPVVVYPPDPGFVDPAYADVAGWLREALKDPDRHDVVVNLPEAGELAAPWESLWPMSRATKLVLLHKQVAIGLAPYVGQPFLYVWSVWMGKDGPALAGPAVINHVPPRAPRR